jgi:Uma2 family endonuclease
MRRSNGETGILPLKDGDHLDRKTDHARYEAMPESFRPELIGGFVYLRSQVNRLQSRSKVRLLAWLSSYETATPGVEADGTTTVLLGDHSEPEPDASLVLITPGMSQTWIEDDYLAGAPELVLELGMTPAGIELHQLREDYQQAGVREYLVVVQRPAQVLWFVSRGGQFQELAPGSDGILRSEVFPGLWLDPAALLHLDGARVLEVLRQGLATPEHAAFVASLAAL